jgi:hypothetical protein
MSNDSQLSQTPSVQKQTIQAWYRALVKWDLETAGSLMHDDYTHITLPATADDGVKNKEEGLAHARAMSDLFGQSPIEVRHPVDERQATTR